LVVQKIVAALVLVSIEFILLAIVFVEVVLRVAHQPPPIV